MRTVFAFSLAVTCMLAAESRADNWPNWRGPHGNGVADGADYPIRWNAKDGFTWKFELPGTGSSTPAVWEGRIFVTCASDSQNLLVCLNREGKELWRRPLGKPRHGRHKKATGANSSPIVDGERVYAYFKSGDLACLDLEGKLLWKENLQERFAEDTLWWDLGTSPVLTKDHVVVACMQSGPSYLAAFAKQTGELAWKVNRVLDAPEESSQSYSTPVVRDNADGSQTLVVLGADHVTAHHASNGEEIWRVGGLNPSGNRYFRSISSPVVAGKIVVAPYARGKSLTAIELGGNGDVTQTHVKWRRPVSADVPTPIANEKTVYLCTDRGKVYCFDLATGNERWTFQAPRTGGSAYSSSPILAGDRLYLTREDGRTSVIQLGDEPRLLAENSLDEMTVATPVLVDGQIFVRTLRRVYCIQKSDQ